MEYRHGELLYAIWTANCVAIVSVLFQKGRIFENGIPILLVSSNKPSHIGKQAVRQIEHQGWYKVTGNGSAHRFSKVERVVLNTGCRY